jgi:hypothetical protein
MHSITTYNFVLAISFHQYYILCWNEVNVLNSLKKISKTTGLMIMEMNWRLIDVQRIWTNDKIFAVINYRNHY